MKWIKVEDRLPEDDLNIIGCDVVDKRVFICFYDKNVDAFYALDSFSSPRIIVTHWMLLHPLPYEE